MRSRRRIVLAGVGWTVVMLAVAVVLALEAIASLTSAQQACFFNFPEVPCPAGDDPATIRLTFAFLGVPALWLVGLVVGFVALAVRRRGRT